jgi:hypothetical protein
MARLFSVCAALMVVAVMAAVGCSGPAAPAFHSDEDLFLFGSIGAANDTGVPYWIWLVLPRVFPEHLPAPGGYPALGIGWKEGQEMPVGLSKAETGDHMVAINCAMCHTTVETRPSLPPKITAVRTPARGPGRPVQQYLGFLVRAASDPRFTSSTILAEIARQHDLSLLQRLRYRFLLIPLTRGRLRDLGQVEGLLDGNVNWLDHDFDKWSTDMAGVNRAASYLK